MRILVAGAKGMLGQVFRRITSGRHDVVEMDIRELDITKRKDTEKTIAAVTPDIVVNCAAYTDVDGCESNRERAFAVNSLGVKNLAEACDGGRRTLVHISTDYVFDGSKKTPYTEEDLPCPINVYGESKLEGERYLLRTLPEERYVLVRSQWLYGEGGKNFVDTILARARETPELRVVNDQFGSPTWSRDLAPAILLLIDMKLRGTFHITNRGVVTWYDFAGAIVEKSGLHCTILPQSSGDAKRPARRPPYSALDCSKYEGKTGMRLRHWEEAVADYLRTGGRE